MRMSAGDRFFLDTNVLLYAVDATDRVKHDAARAWLDALWQTGAGRLSWQVLHEFYANAVRKIGAATAHARATVQVFAEWQPVDVTLGLIERAWRWSDEAQLSYGDALIVAAAERAGCAWLVSEDFQPGRTFEALRVVNPFHAPPGAYGLLPA